MACEIRRNLTRYAACLFVLPCMCPVLPLIVHTRDHEHTYIFICIQWKMYIHMHIDCICICILIYICIRNTSRQCIIYTASFLIIFSINLISISVYLLSWFVYLITIIFYYGTFISLSLSYEYFHTFQVKPLRECVSGFNLDIKEIHQKFHLKKLDLNAMNAPIHNYFFLSSE